MRSFQSLSSAGASSTRSISILQTFRGLDNWNAYAAFEEGIKGSLTPGKLADITVLSEDITSVPEDQIRNAQVVYTIVGGKIMYQK